MPQHSTVDWINKFCIFTVAYPVAMQTNKIVIITCDEPHKQMLSKRNQTQKRAYIIQFHVCKVQKQAKPNL